MTLSLAKSHPHSCNSHKPSWEIRVQVVHNQSYLLPSKLDRKQILEQFGFLRTWLSILSIAKAALIHIDLLVSQQIGQTYKGPTRVCRAWLHGSNHSHSPFPSHTNKGLWLTFVLHAYDSYSELFSRRSELSWNLDIVVDYNQILYIRALYYIGSLKRNRTYQDLEDFTHINF
ncbi:hypothetical protein VNO77_04130 [Canavalia gladiata]|uniref:Uncharacterized protein n=1 Tax=Canavalia gladiata TaxID=3824 RepID=A0AAN9N2H4_CANGL